MTVKVMATDVVALWQNIPKESQAALHVTALSPLYAKYTTSVDTAPAARTTYVSSCIKYVLVTFQVHLLT